jgi:hypothetical protein
LLLPLLLWAWVGPLAGGEVLAAAAAAAAAAAVGVLLLQGKQWLSCAAAKGLLLELLTCQLLLQVLLQGLLLHPDLLPVLLHHWLGV